MASSFPPPPRHPPPLLPPQPQLIAPTPPPPHSVPESEDQSNGSATASMLLVRRLPEAIPHDVLSRLFSHYGASSVRPRAGKVVFASESHLLLRLPLAKVSYIARSIVESPSTGESGDGNPTSGGFDTAHPAARAYYHATIKFPGFDADINFNLSDYDEDLKQMRNLSKEEFVHILRRQSTGFARGSSKYRGVMLHKCGRWVARMGQFLGKKAYDKVAIKCNGREAKTNFEPSHG